MVLRTQASKFISGKTRITYGAAIFLKQERRAIEKVLDRNWWQIDGEGKLFEEELAAYIGKKYCVMTNSGSSALLIAISALDLPKGSGVVIPATNFPTAFNPLIFLGYVPYVVDVDLETFDLNLADTEKALQMGAKAIIAVHIAGSPANMPEVMQLAKKYGAIVIEDNCDGFGGELHGKKFGSFGDIGCTSFHAGHIMTTGEGGALFTDDPKLAERFRSLRDWGRAGETDANYTYPDLPIDYPGRYTYVSLGYNLKPLELQAALGRVQLRRIDAIRKKRQDNFKKLFTIFSGRKGITLLSPLSGTNPSWFSFPLLAAERPKFRKYLEGKNIETRPVFAGNILAHPAYQKVKVKKISSLKNATRILNEGMFIGLHPLLPSEAFVYIRKVIDEYFRKQF